jgi:hypothetical protein
MASLAPDRRPLNALVGQQQAMDFDNLLMCRVTRSRPGRRNGISDS